jgi:cytochrome P450
MLDADASTATTRGKMDPLLGCRFILESFRNPIRFSEHIYRRFGPIAEFDMPSLRRHTPRKQLFVIGPEHNREVLRNTDAIRPSGLWSLDGPPGSALHAIQHHYSLKIYGVSHASIVQGVNPPLGRSRVEGHFAQTRAIMGDEIAQWPHDRTVDLYDVVRKLSQRVSFTLLFGETDISRIRRFGDLVFKYHRGNWDALSYLFPVNLKGTPYHRVRRRPKRCDRISAIRSPKRGRDRPTTTSQPRLRTSRMTQAPRWMPKKSSAAWCSKRLRPTNRCRA